MAFDILLTDERRGQQLKTRLTQVTECTAFDLKGIVRETLMIAGECDLTGDSPSQLLIELVTSVVVQRLQKGSVQ